MRLVLAVGAFLLGTLAAGCAQPSARVRPVATAARGVIQARFPIEQYVLGNGLRVALHPDSSAPVVAVHLRYKVGAKDDFAGKDGLAHLVEHLMFEGSRGVGEGQFHELIERAGARGVNATTGYDDTRYYEVMPAAQLPLALWLESDRMGSMLERLTQERLDNQRMVVKNERLEGLGRDPDDRVASLLSRSLFAEGHPYRRTVIGDEKTLDAISLDDVRRFFAAYYGPSNATLVLAGSFDVAEAKALIERSFGAIPARAAPQAQVSGAAASSEQRVTIENGAKLRELAVGYAGPPDFSPDEPAVLMAMHALRTRLRARLVKKDSPVSSVQLRHHNRLLSDDFWVRFSLKREADEEAILKAVDEELESLRAVPVDPGFLGSLAEEAYARVFMSTQSMADRASRFARYDLVGQNAALVQEDAERFNKVTPEQVQAAVARYLRSPGRVVGRVVPKEGAPRGGRASIALDAAAPASAPTPAAPQLAPWPQDPARKGPPAPLSRPPFEAPVPEEFRLESGVRVLFLPRQGAHTVGLRIQVARGAFDADAGVAALAARMLLNSGTKKRSEQQVRDAFSALGVERGVFFNGDVVELSATALSLRAVRAAELLIDGLLHPALNDSEIEEERGLQIRAVKGSRAELAPALSPALSLALFPPSSAHPGGPSSTEELLRKVKRQDIERFVAGAVRPELITVIVAGGFDAEGMREALGVLFGGLKPGGEALPRRAIEPAAPSERRVVLVDVPGALQSRIALVAALPPLGGQERAGQLVLSQLFGGSFSSRTNAVLREKYGLTYGFRAHFYENLRLDTLEGSGSVVKDRTAEAVKALLQEAERMARGEFDEAEIAAAKDRAVNQVEGAFETASEATAVLAAATRHGGGAGALRERLAAVRGVDGAALKKLAAGRFDGSRLRVLVAGDAASLEEPLKALGLGPVVVLREAAAKEGK